VLYQTFVRPLAFLLPSEAAHHLAFAGLRAVMRVPLVAPAARALFAPHDPRLAVRALGQCFPGPVGLAAGFDKDGVGVDALGALGFGFVEVGTVTAEPQPGNARPRLFRLPADRALVNRMGFNNRGSRELAKRLARPHRTLVGANLGKTKATPEEQAALDYAISAERLARHAAYVVVNVSSPNTPGLRSLQAVEKLGPVLEHVRAALSRACPERRVPLLVKIAPDLADADVDAVTELCLSLGLEGLVTTNTTIGREGLRSSAAAVEAVGAGGLSGAPLRARALEVLRRVRSRAGRRLTLVGVGGIETVDDAWQRIAAGASLVQLYTAFVYEGPLLAARLHRGLARRLEREGVASIEALVGRDAR
jgi:dihydroorotate dehydrogenase